MAIGQVGSGERFLALRASSIYFGMSKVSKLSKMVYVICKMAKPKQNIIMVSLPTCFQLSYTKLPVNF